MENFQEELERERRSRLQYERQCSALQAEFLEYKAQVEKELERTATEHVALQTRLIEQSVELAEAKAMIDDLMNSKPVSKSPKTEASNLINYFFKSDELSFYKNRCAQLEMEKADVEKDCEKRFKEWRKIVLDRVDSERRNIRSRIQHDALQPNAETPPRSPREDLDDPAASAAAAAEEEDDELSYMFDKLDWTKPIPRSN